MKKIKVFFCYRFEDEEVVNVFKDLLSKGYKQTDREKECDIFFYSGVQKEFPWEDIVPLKIRDCDVFCLFMGSNIGNTQKNECYIYTENCENKKLIKIKLPNYNELGFLFAPTKNELGTIVLPQGSSQESIYKKAVDEFVRSYFGMEVDYSDDLPSNPYLFDYEKTIIDFFKFKSEFICDRDKTINENKLNDFLKAFCSIDDYNVSLGENNKQKRARVIEIINTKIKEGCSDVWPKVAKRAAVNSNINMLNDIGSFRLEDAEVLVAALSKYHFNEHCCMCENHLTFPEAGPREKLYFNPKGKLRVAILVSGGIAPGINAVIDGITQRHYKYYKANRAERDNRSEIEIFGIKNGFKAFNNDNFDEEFVYLIDDFTSKSRGQNRTEICTSDYINEGGSIIGTSREPSLIKPDVRVKKLEQIVERLRHQNIRILYIIGGDGSMKAAHAISHISERFKTDNWDLSVVGIPKTMDNDVLWVWQTFGFTSAVEKAREFVEILNTEVRSNPRLGIVQLFGSDSGFVVSHTVLASKTGICDIALIPEEKFSMAKLLKEVERIKTDKGYGLIVMSETAIPTDATNYLKAHKDKGSIGLNEKERNAIEDFIDKRKNGKHIEGQTNDHLRSGGLKIVARCIKDTYGDDFRVLINEPRHILRAIPPSTNDIIFGSRLGTLAVDNAMAGYHDFMISQWLTEFVLVPLKLVILGRKRIPNTGVFWKSVLAKTGQPPDMVI